VYDAGDSDSLQAALTANLTTATTVLEQLGSASDRLVAGLGTGELSGKGYSAVQALFAQVIAPSVTAAKAEVGAIRGELEKYTWEDSKVSQFGVLKEDELNKQLVATTKQRDATEHLIEVNTRAANATTAVPGLIEAMEVRNRQLEVALNYLENEIKDLQGRLNALHGFAQATKGLFSESVGKLDAATRDTGMMLAALATPMGGLSGIVVSSGTGVAATRREFLDYLAGDTVKGRAIRGGGHFGYPYGYKHVYNLGPTLSGKSPEQIFDYIKSHFGEVFPPAWTLDGSTRNLKLTNVGQVIYTRLHGTDWQGLTSGSIKVTELTDTGYTIEAMPGHPEYPGTVQFSVRQSECEGVYLEVKAGYREPKPIPNNDLYSLFTESLWNGYEQNIRAGMLGLREPDNPFDVDPSPEPSDPFDPFQR
jgi:hypothetical protein